MVHCNTDNDIGLHYTGIYTLQVYTIYTTGIQELEHRTSGFHMSCRSVARKIGQIYGVISTFDTK
jgi:hypothetical protein